MTQADLVDIRAAVERALAGSKVTAHRITVMPLALRVELELHGSKDNAAAVRACLAVARLLPAFNEIVVGWEPS